MSIRTRFGASLILLPVVLIIGAGVLAIELRQSEAAAFESLDKPQDGKPREAREREEREKKEKYLKEVAARGGEWELGFRLGDRAEKGAPFSAQLIIETTQTLANGVHLSHQSTGALYRDSEGRTRSEQPSEGAPEIVVINDPVGGALYKIHMFQRKVIKVTFSDKEPDHEIALKREKEHAREIEIKRREKESEPERKTESLGAQVLEGVRAEGTRITITIPAGREGNDRPFEIVSEKWYSPELRMIIMTKRNDPRTGEQVFRLANINRSEPSRSLFEAPTDFSIKEEKVEARRKE